MSTPNLNISYRTSGLQPVLKVLAARSWDFLLFTLLLLYKIMAFNTAIGVAQPRGFICASLGSIFILFSCILMLRLRLRTIFFYLCDLLLSFIILADLLFFRYYGDVISIPVLLQIAQADSVKQSVFVLLEYKDLIFVLDLLLLIPLLFLIDRKRSRRYPENSRYKATQAVPVLCIGIILVLSIFVNLSRHMGAAIFNNILDQTFFVENIGVLNFHAFDLYKYAKKQLHREQLALSDQQKIAQWFRQQPSNGQKNNEFYAAAKGHNLIIIQVEALQSFVINKSVNGQAITPNLNKLLKDSIYFPNHYFQTAQGNTSDAEFLTNVSLYPAATGSAFFQYADKNYEALPRVLKEAGYTCLAFHAYKPSYWNRAAMYQSLGFDRFYSAADFTLNEKVGWGLGDKSFLTQTAGKLQQLAEPFYAFIITLSSHYPYNAFSADPAFNVGEYSNTFLGNYLQALNYTDAAIGLFIEELQASGLWNDSVVVIYGDHSAVSKAEKNDLLNFLEADPDDLTWATMQKVPLLIHLPENRGAGPRPIVAGQIDLFPTLANLLGAPAPVVMGHDLLNTERNTVIFRNGSFTDGEIFYLQSAEEVYDLRSAQRLPLDQYTKEIEDARLRLWISDMVLEHNLIGKLPRKD